MVESYVLGVELHLTIFNLIYNYNVLNDLGTIMISNVSLVKVIYVFY